MSRIRDRGEAIRKFVLENVDSHATDISKVTSEKFGISRQAVNKHLKKLTAEEALTEAGSTKGKKYSLAPLVDSVKSYPLLPGLAEDQVWTKDVQPALGALPDNILNIWHYAFTEMFNNAIDHSGATKISVHLKRTAIYTEILISDDGVGIFKKIQAALGLLDERHALLELSKGKLTTDPSRHSGEGIFFTSRGVDSFDILSGGVFFTHEFGKSDDWLMELDTSSAGTFVWMKLSNHTSRTMKKIYDIYAAGEDFGFNKTIVPVTLARYGGDQLISRSQAKRVLSRVELFKYVVFDFKGVTTVGQAFADEIFRVFSKQHPDIQLDSIHTNAEVEKMIQRAKAGLIVIDPKLPESPSLN